MLEELRNYLRADEEDNILTDLLKKGQGYVNGLAGVTLDFESNALAKNLLLDYCRYSYNNASEYFLENFREDILRLQLESAVIDSVKQAAENEGTI